MAVLGVPTCIFGLHSEVLEPLGEVLDDVIVVEEGREAAVDDLGRHGAVGPDVGQQEARAEVRILLLDFCFVRNEKNSLDACFFRIAQ